MFGSLTTTGRASARRTGKWTLSVHDVVSLCLKSAALILLGILGGPSIQLVTTSFASSCAVMVKTREVWCTGAF